MLLEKDQLNEILQNYQSRSREALLPILWDVQTAFGHIDADAVRQISMTLRVPEADIYGVIGFYTLFHTKPTGNRIVRVCNSPTCHMSGASQLLQDFESRLHADDSYTIEETECLGLCDAAPAVLLSETGYGETLCGNVNHVDSFLDNPTQFDYESIAYANPSVLLNKENAKKPFATLKKVFETDISPEKIIEEIQASKLIGRGGAAFPTGLKWKLTREAAGKPKYVVCNADESEPGTFKDRYLLEKYPHLVLEGMILAGYAIGANQGYLFIRGEYPKATHILQEAIEIATAQNFLGGNILGSKFSFTIEIRRGAGAYICGEETALFEAIEGNRGFPRIKPPYPTTHGLFGKPTVANNVETLCNVPFIIDQGAQWYTQFGTEDSTGTKLLSVSGHVNQPGVYEIEPGITLSTLLEEYCHGIQGTLQAVLMGGAAGTFLTPDEIDVKLTFEDLRAIKSTMGSGAIMVFNDSIDLRSIFKRLGHFFQHESCGKCYPCQLGTQRQVEILDRIDTPLIGDSQRLQDVGLTMTEASICGLGQTASSAILSAMKKFPHYFK